MFELKQAAHRICVSSSQDLWLLVKKYAAELKAARASRRRVHVYKALQRHSLHAGMPLTTTAMTCVVQALRCADVGKKRRAFNALLPLLNLNRDEVESEFARVINVLRYVAALERDHAALASIHMHEMSCRVQSLVSCRRLI